MSSPSLTTLFSPGLPEEGWSIAGQRPIAPTSATRAQAGEISTARSEEITAAAYSEEG